MAESYGWLAALEAANALSGSPEQQSQLVEAANAAGADGTIDQIDWGGMFATAPAPAPAPAVRRVAAQTGGGGLPVSMSGLFNAASLNSPGSSPVATGFPLLDRMIDNLLRARADQRADRQQAIDLARLMAELSRISPTRAASMAASLGIEGPGADLAFTNLFGQQRGGFPQAGGPAVSGTIGGQQIGLPSVFTGQELSFLGSNLNVARVTADVADYLGVPDIFSRSAAARIPTMSSILGGGF
mgnify:CR=1 FL=1